MRARVWWAMGCAGNTAVQVFRSMRQQSVLHVLRTAHGPGDWEDDGVRGLDTPADQLTGGYETDADEARCQGHDLFV